MITAQEFVRGIIVVGFIIGLSLFGRWMAMNDPGLLNTFRFVNGITLLFLLVVMLFKWHQVRTDLMTHRADIVSLVREIRDFVMQTEKRRDERVEELFVRVTSLAAQAAQETQDSSRAIHERLDTISGKQSGE